MAGGLGLRLPVRAGWLARRKQDRTKRNAQRGPARPCHGGRGRIPITVKALGLLLVCPLFSGAAFYFTINRTDIALFLLEARVGWLIGWLVS